MVLLYSSAPQHASGELRYSITCARDSVAEYDLLSARAECYDQRGNTAAAAADLTAMRDLAQQLNDLPRQLAAVTRLYEHEHMARIELEQRLAARATELEIINGMGQVLAQQLELQAVIDLVGDKIREILHPETIDIRLYDRRSNLIHTPYQYDAGHRIIKQPFPLGRGLTSRVIESRRPLLLGTDQEAQALGAIQTYRDPNDPDEAVTESFLGVPIIVGDDVIGALDVQSYQQHAYGQADVRLLTTLAASMGVAIQNTRLFAAERQRAAELESMISAKCWPPSAISNRLSIWWAINCARSSMWRWCLSRCMIAIPAGSPFLTMLKRASASTPTRSGLAMG